MLKISFLISLFTTLGKIIIGVYNFDPLSLVANCNL